jgi:hypothetical protein
MPGDDQDAYRQLNCRIYDLRMWELLHVASARLGVPLYQLIQAGMRPYLEDLLGQEAKRG